MLTYAIGFVQNVQLVCFAVVFVCMWLQDRANRSMGWLACEYLAGAAGAALQLAAPVLPAILAAGLSQEAPVVGYACLHAGIVTFFRRGRSTLWISLALILINTPLCLAWSHPGGFSKSSILIDGVLAIQTAISTALLISTREAESSWPRRLMALFLAVYSAVEFARVAVFLVTHKLPGEISPAVETASGIVYVVSCSVLPLAFIWMMNTRLHADLTRQSHLDPLTGILNRRGLEIFVDQELARLARSRQDFAVVTLDIDHFKQVNDSLGHSAGDEVLCAVSRLFASMLRENDAVGRLGGEEFALILPMTSRRAALPFAERIRTTLAAETIRLTSTSVHVAASFGITCTAGRHGIPWTTLLDEADRALYEAKRLGRNRTVVYGEAPGDPQQPGANLLATAGR